MSVERHFDQELTDLKDVVLRLASLAEQSVVFALKALMERDDKLAEKVIADDTALDLLEKEIDDRAIKLLALRQPTASDLRFITMAMKICNELERIGDEAVNIAVRAKELSQESQLKPWVDIPRMADLARGMIREALDAFVYRKPDQALAVVQRDASVDQLNHQICRELTSYMIEDPHTVTRALNLIRVSHNIERIADHATNIAEEIVFLYEARDIRHTPV